MKSYKEMNWEELEEHLNAIRQEILKMREDEDLWESRNIAMNKDFYERLEELELEVDYIQALQRGLEDKA